jgi:biotin synthase-related radical SAM superfamily protein
MNTVDFTSTILSRKQFLLSELQTHGLRLKDPVADRLTRIGGAGPSDHRALSVLGTTVMIPVHTRGAAQSPYFAAPPDERGKSLLQRGEETLCEISFPLPPKF